MKNKCKSGICRLKSLCAHCQIPLRSAAAAILLCSADLDEVFRLSDRIITLYEGEITGQFRTDAISKEELGYYMTGARREEEKTHG